MGKTGQLNHIRQDNDTSRTNGSVITKLADTIDSQSKLPHQRQGLGHRKNPAFLKTKINNFTEIKALQKGHRIEKIVTIAPVFINPDKIGMTYFSGLL